MCRVFTSGSFCERGVLVCLQYFIQKFNFRWLRKLFRLSLVPVGCSFNGEGPLYEKDVGCAVGCAKVVHSDTKDL